MISGSRSQAMERIYGMSCSTNEIARYVPNLWQLFDQGKKGKGKFYVYVRNKEATITLSGNQISCDYRITWDGHEWSGQGLTSCQGAIKKINDVIHTIEKDATAEQKLPQITYGVPGGEESSDSFLSDLDDAAVHNESDSEENDHYEK